MWPACGSAGRLSDRLQLLFRARRWPRAGIELRHVGCSTQRRDVPHRAALRAGRPLFRRHGGQHAAHPACRPAIVSCSICRGFPAAHGAPVHVGDPRAIGIADAGRARLRRPGTTCRRRSAGVLGLRRDAAMGGQNSRAAAVRYPRARQDVPCHRSVCAICLVWARPSKTVPEPWSDPMNMDSPVVGGSTLANGSSGSTAAAPSPTSSAARPGRRLSTHKLLSENPERYARRRASPASAGCSGWPLDAPIPAGRVDAVKMGTTVATNALLERKGERTAAGDQPRLRATRCASATRPGRGCSTCDIVLPALLYERRRRDRRARRRRRRRDLQPLDEAPPARALRRRPRQRASRRCAIVLMHAWNYPAHEQRLAALARARRASPRSPLSHEVSPLLQLVPRGDTTVVDAYLSPILRRYVDQVAAELAGRAAATSCSRNGGLAEAQRFQGKDAILSGPGRRHRRRRAHRRAWPGSTASSASTWAAPRPTSRHYAGELRAHLRDRGGRRAHARADDGASTRWRPAAARSCTSTAPASASARISAGANPGPGLLPPRRPADRDRRQCLRGQDPARALSRRCSAPTATSRWMREVVRSEIRRAGRRDRRGHRRAPRPARSGRRLPAHRRGQHGQRDQAGLGAAGPRRHRATRCSASAAPAASTPAWWPTRWA